jgi:PAS domain S-box-containing protein
MAEQFNSQQLILAQETTTGIEEYLGSLKRNLRLISSMKDWFVDGELEFTTKLQNSFQGTPVIDVWQINQRGVIDYSLVKLAATYSQTLAEQFWQELSQMEPGEIKISGLFKYEHSSSYATKAIIMATRLIPPVSSAADERDDSPQVLAFVISFNKIITKFISPIRSGKTGFAWLLDENGVLLHHPEHPEMVDRSVFNLSRECRKCHLSFDMERKMVKGKKRGKGRYLSVNKEDKLIAYSPINIGQRHWTIAVYAPYSEVTQLVRNSFYHIMFFSIVIIASLLGVNVFIFRINKERMQAENRALYADKLEQDVQERTREIKQEKQKLDDIVSAIGAELSVIDKKFRILWANEKVTRRFGPLESINGTPCYKTFYGRGDICPKCVATKTFQYGQVQQNEIKVNNQGHTAYYQITTTPITNSAGEVVQVLVLLQDITTQKQQEQILIDSERVSAVGKIAVGLAHDLGNPLSIIAGSAQFCLKNLKAPPSIKEYLQVINRNASAASKVIKALLQFARPSGEPVFSPVDLKE